MMSQMDVKMDAQAVAKVVVLEIAMGGAQIIVKVYVGAIVGHIVNQQLGVNQLVQIEGCSSTAALLFYFYGMYSH